jgi:hypothetical protein
MRHYSREEAFFSRFGDFLRISCRLGIGLEVGGARAPDTYFMYPSSRRQEALCHRLGRIPPPLPGLVKLPSRDGGALFSNASLTA